MLMFSVQVVAEGVDHVEEEAVEVNISNRAQLLILPYSGCGGCGG